MKQFRNILHTLEGRAFSIGVMSILVVFFSFTALTSLSKPLLNTADEALHLDYAWQVAHGELPTLPGGPLYDTHLIDYLPKVQWVWQHPPLFYTLISPVVGYSAAHTDASHVVLYARLATAILGTIALAAVMLFTYLVLPHKRHRKTATLIAGALVSLSAIFITVSGTVYNDAVPFALSALTLGYTAYMLRLTKFAPINYAILAILLSLGMLSRSIFITTAATVLVTLAIRIYNRSSRRRSDLLYLTASGIVPLLVSGWFYFRNYQLSGNPLGTGGAQLPGMLQYFPDSIKYRVKTSVIDQLLSYDYWQVVGSIINGGLKLLTLTILFVAMLWAGKTIFSNMRRKVYATDTYTITMITSFALLQIVAAAYYMSGGGGHHVRYLIPLLLPLAYAVARFIMSLNIRPHYFIATAGFSYVLSIYLYLRSLATSHMNSSETFLDVSVVAAIKRGMVANHFEKTYVVTALVAIVVIFAIVAIISIYSTYRQKE